MTGAADILEGRRIYIDELLDDEDEELPLLLPLCIQVEQADIETARVNRPTAAAIMRLRISGSFVGWKERFAVRRVSVSRRHARCATMKSGI